MTNKTLDKPKTTDIKELQREVELLRSFVIGHVGRDSEGEYRPEFVKRILQTSDEGRVEHVFKDKESLSAYLNENKD